MTLNPTDPVFISYRQADGTTICAELAWLLRASGIPVWRDRDDLPPGDTERRLVEAMNAGLSGAVLVITPDVENSEVVKFVEAPQLIDLHTKHPDFVLGIANAVHKETGGLDYKAPDRLLAKRSGTLSGVDQTATTRAGLIDLVGKIMFERIAAQRDVIATNSDTITLNIQTRNTPQVYDRTGADLDIRLRPGTHERLPSGPGLTDLADVIKRLPDAITRSAATKVEVCGGAHLSVAFTLGAAIPSTRVGNLGVRHQDGQLWTSTPADGASQQVRAQSTSANPEPPADQKPAVAVYVDLLPTRSDAAFERYLDENKHTLTAWAHLRPVTDGPLEPANAGVIAKEVAHYLRQLSDANANANLHLMLRCPFPIAVLIGRLTNTLRTTVYEWDDTDTNDGDYRPRYRPVLDVRTSATDGVIQRVYAQS